MTIYIDLTVDLPKLVATFEVGGLQMQSTDMTTSRCMYSGPCGVGVMMSEADRDYLDGFNMSTIGKLIEEGIVKVPNVNQARDLMTLQRRHDGVMFSKFRKSESSENARLTAEENTNFVDFLNELKEKYLAH